MPVQVHKCHGQVWKSKDSFWNQLSHSTMASGIAFMLAGQHGQHLYELDHLTDSIYCSVFVRLCVWCACVCVCAHMHACMQKVKAAVRAFLYHCRPYSLRQSNSVEPSTGAPGFSTQHQEFIPKYPGSQMGKDQLVDHIGK